jgi:hypothetical protein
VPRGAVEKVWSLRELGATPDVPFTGVPFGRVPDAVQRLEMKRVGGDADFLSGVRLDRKPRQRVHTGVAVLRSTIPFAGSLLRLQLEIHDLVRCDLNFSHDFNIQR